jgi:large subunit ribosomal protein L4
MPEIKVYNDEGQAVSQLDVSEEVFGRKMNRQVVFDTLNWYLASRRRGTHSTKTRAEVSGGGVKPWKQKGTGRARAGSNRSPLWRKGGVVFGPKPRDYSYSLPLKMRKQALKVALSDKVRSGRFRVLEALKVAKPKTRLVAQLLKQQEIKGKVLCVLGEENREFSRAARNIKGVTLLRASALNVFDLINAAWLLADKAAVLKIEEILGHAA